MKYSTTILIGAALLAMGITSACGDDGPGESAIEMVSLDIIEPASVTSGSEILVESVIRSDVEVRDLGFMVMMIRDGETRRQIVLGNTFKDIGIGESTRQMWVTMPDDASEFDDWRLVAVVDWKATIDEENRNDNGQSIPLSVQAASSNAPDIVLQDALCDRCEGQRLPLRDSIPSFVLDLQLLAKGPSDVTDAEVTVTLDIPDDGQGSEAAGLVALEIYNNDTEAFEPSFRIPVMAAGQATPAHLMVRFPEPLRTLLNAHPGQDTWEAEMQVEVNPTGAIEENESRFMQAGIEDNVLTHTLVLERLASATFVGGDSVVFDETFLGNTRTMPWPLQLGILLKPVQLFLIKISPVAAVRGHAGKISGAHLEATGNLRHHVFPGWIAEPAEPIIEFDFVFDADKDDLAASIYSLDLKVNGDPVDTSWVEDFSDCTLENISIPLILAEENPREDTGVCSSDGCLIDFVYFRLRLDGGLRATMDLGLAACESGASTTDQAAIQAAITRHNTASFFTSVVVGAGEESPLPSAPGLGALNGGLEQEITIIDETEVMTATAAAGLPGSAGFPTGGGELSYQSSISTAYLGVDLKKVIELDGTAGACLRVADDLFHDFEFLLVGSKEDCEDAVHDVTGQLIYSTPPIFQTDAVITPTKTYRFDFD